MEKMDAYDMKLLEWWHEYWLNASCRPASANTNTIERCTTLEHGLVKQYDKCTGAQEKLTRRMERLAQSSGWQHSWMFEI
jgi:hypothetical protein